MNARFLLGPAGSGKTFRCLAEIRDLLKNNPEGAPVIFLAPKQATFQLERQLLAQESLSGFARLHILSFERLARFVFEALNSPPARLLSEEGRVMVLRALLLQHEGELKLFRRSARRPGFAEELSRLLRELQQHQVTSVKLRELARGKSLRTELREKLEDLAMIQEGYSEWFTGNGLQDGNCLLDLATDVLQKSNNPGLKIQNLYLDGFAEMTPQELDLLAAFLPFCGDATMAFCLDEKPAKKDDNSWLSIWNTVDETFQECRRRIENLPGANVAIEILPRNPKQSRFSKSSELAHLEKSWARVDIATPGRMPEEPAGWKPTLQGPDKSKAQCSKIEIYSCPDPEAEAVLAAREISRFVRAGNRFRDCAVLVRDLENYHKPLARTFRRYGIPFFLDRRESVAHHPLAELTRGVLRMAAYDWQHDDFFSALKAGFCAVEETDIDHLENAALEFGWRGGKWREPLPDASFEQLRKKILPPFEKFYGQLVKLEFKPVGKQMAGIVRRLWEDLDVEKVMEKWSVSEENESSIHATVLEQMNALVDDLELGFADKALPLRDWLPIIESGLAKLTVGVIPPVLDEVLIGAIDRARNPDLKLTLVLGMNESVFPATPAAPVILTETDRAELQVPLGPDLREQVARERFYGYIACTRSSERLTLAFSRNATNGTVLNPSPFIAQLQQIFPSLEIEEFQNDIRLEDAENPAEIAPLVFENQRLGDLPGLADLTEDMDELREPDPAENLSPPVAARLYGPTLRTSVSRLEEFAACPFRFFVRSGLRAEERKIFELDARERGSFQHDILKKFHEQVMAENKRWRDLTPQQARDRIGQIAMELSGDYRSGLLNETAQSRFAARAITESLQDFVAVTISWLREQNEFDPVAAELDFGTKETPQTAWEIGLDHGRALALKGRIDRVDLYRGPDGRTLATVVDYKSSQKQLDAILVEHGIQLQLLAYLNVLRHWKNPRAPFGADRLVPTGVFYVNLRGQFENGGSRDDVLGGSAESQRAAYQHAGRFDADALKKLDSKYAHDQFKYRLTKDGELYANSVEALSHTDFQKLLDRVEVQLRDFGNAIFSGLATVDPYRKGKQTPCEYCDYRPACRIDSWTHKYRMLRPEEE
ncbi:MAG TPA: PD-(D/E)XK nuclease family protein [Verrucomicrobiae bacterium]